MKKAYWILWLVMLSISTTMASSPFVITADFEKVSFEAFGEVLQTDDEAIESVLQSTDYQLLKTTGTYFQASKYVYWVRGTVENKSNEPQDLIVEVRNTYVNFLQFFWTDTTGELQQSEKTGDYFPFHQRPIYHRYFAHKIRLAPKETTTIYIFLDKQGETIEVDVQLWEQTAFERLNRKENFITTLLLGGLVCVSIFVSLVALISWKKLFLVFALYCLTCTLLIFMISGYGFMYLWSDFPILNSYGYFLSGFYLLCLLLMTQIYFDLKVRFSILYKIATFFIWGLLLTSPFVFFNRLLPSTFKVFITNFAYINYLLVLLFLIITPIISYRKSRNRWDLIFLLGFLISMLALSFFSIQNLGLVGNYWSVLLAIFCLITDFSILMIIFANQIRQTYTQNAELNVQLQKNKLEAANSLLTGQMEERHRLSTDLHDSISVNLSILKMQLQNIFAKFQLSQETEAQKAVHSISKITSDIRNFTHAILPLNLNLQSFQEGVTDLVFNIQEQFEVEITLDFNEFEEAKTSERSQQILYQTIQELLNNTIKYAHATTIFIQLKTTNSGKIALQYQDNGNGFDINKIKKGIGLKNMEARAKLLNGDFEIQSDENGSRFNFSISENI